LLADAVLLAGVLLAEAVLLADAGLLAAAEDFDTELDGVSTDEVPPDGVPSFALDPDVAGPELAGGLAGADEAGGGGVVTGPDDFGGVLVGVDFDGETVLEGEVLDVGDVVLLGVALLGVVPGFDVVALGFGVLVVDVVLLGTAGGFCGGPSTDPKTRVAAKSRVHRTGTSRTVRPVRGDSTIIPLPAYMATW
jgi:hypothetical protein